MQSQAEMMIEGSNDGKTPNFRIPTCLPTVSSTKSFTSSLSMNGSGSNKNGNATSGSGTNGNASISSGSNMNGNAFNGNGMNRNAFIGSGMNMNGTDFNGSGMNGNAASGSGTNMNGNALSLVGVPQALNPPQPHKQTRTNFGQRSGRCYCLRKRKFKVRRSIKVLAISNNNADIPADEYSWRKYGQKPVKGSPYPRPRGRPRKMRKGRRVARIATSDNKKEEDSVLLTPDEYCGQKKQKPCVGIIKRGKKRKVRARMRRASDDIYIGEGLTIIDGLNFVKAVKETFLNETDKYHEFFKS